MKVKLKFLSMKILKIKLFIRVEALVSILLIDISHYVSNLTMTQRSSIFTSGTELRTLKLHLEIHSYAITGTQSQ